MIRLEEPAAPIPRAEFDITNRNIVRTGIGTDLTLRVIAMVGDPETGIASVTINSSMNWRCQIRTTSEVIGVLQTADVTFDPITQPPTPGTPIQINVAANPVAQAGCARASAGNGSVQLVGHVRVIATNGAGGVTSSQMFSFEYANALGPSTGTDLTDGTMGPGTETLYIAECRSRGMPIPTGWSPTSTAWVRHGNLRDDNANLLMPGGDAYVWTYTDPAVRGACIALPRGAGGSRGGLAGIICQSATTGAACFWDSRKRDEANPMAQMPLIDWAVEPLRLWQLKDATNLTESGSGQCPDCHRGNNVFLMAPDAATWQSVIKTATVGSTFTLMVESSSDNQGGMPRYVPITGLGGASRAGWPGNQFSSNTCGSGCHEAFVPPARPSGFDQPSMPPTCAAGAQNATACYR